MTRSGARYEEVRCDTYPSRSVSQRLQLRALPLLHMPGWALATRVPAYRRRLLAFAAEWQPSLVHVAYHVMGQAIGALPRAVPVVLTEHEPGVTSARDAVIGCRGFRGVRARLEAAAWTRFERRVLTQVNAVVVFTGEDGGRWPPWSAACRLSRFL